MVWMQLFWFVVKLVISYAISYALAPKADTPDGAAAAGFDTFNFPTATVGREIPVLFGKKKLSSPNCVWSGDFSVLPITETVDGGLFGSDESYTVAYRYYFGMHLVLAHEIDTITKIEVDDKIVWEGSATGGEITINQPNIFGGDKSGGGISGAVDLLTGAEGQGQNAYLVENISSDVPAYLGVASLVLKSVYFGTSTNLRPWAFWCAKIHDTWYPAKAQIGNDHNPAHIIYAVVTDKNWGMRYNEEDLDLVGLAAAADVLYNEGLGLSILWDHSSRLEDFLLEILKHIDASLFVDRKTGKFTLKLIRPDYDIDLIPFFDESNITKVARFKRRAVNDLVNTVSVKYWDAGTGSGGSTTVTDTALVASMGGTVTQTSDYYGATSHALAATLAGRDLRAFSAPLADAEIYTTRDGSDLNVGDPFLMSWDRYGIEQIVMRVTQIEFGEFGDSNIRILAIEDFYSISDAIYEVPPGTGWVPYLNAPSPCLDHISMEAPFYHMVRATGSTAAEIAATTGGFGFLSGTQPSKDTVSGEGWFNTGAGYVQVGDALAPGSTLQTAVGIADTDFSMTFDLSILNIPVPSWAMIDSEIVRVDGFTAEFIQVSRGCLDTVPAIHEIGARMVFCQFASAYTPSSHTTTIYGKILTATTTGVLPIADAPEQTITINNRLQRPYPPAKLRLDALQEPDALMGTITSTWVHRNRLTQITEIVDTEAASITPEVGTTYTYEIRTLDTGTLLHTETGLTGLTASATAVDIGYNGDIVYTLWSLLGGYDSWQKQERGFAYWADQPLAPEDTNFILVDENLNYITE